MGLEDIIGNYLNCRVLAELDKGYHGPGVYGFNRIFDFVVFLTLMTQIVANYHTLSNMYISDILAIQCLRIPNTTLISINSSESNNSENIIHVQLPYSQKKKKKSTLI